MRTPSLRASWVPCVLFGLGLAACKGDDKLDRDQGLADEALPPECAPGQEQALERKIQTSVSRIRIAQANADLRLMDEHERTLTTLSACGPAFDRYCDASCAGQRASVHLFRAAAIPLLGARSSSVVRSERDLLSEALAGIRIVEAALEKLPRQRGFGARASAEDQAGSGGFNLYLKSQSQLMALRAELQLTAGDIYYRRVSTAKSKAVSFVVNEVLGDVAPPGSGDGSDFDRASFYYEQAYWTLLDARTSIPAELGGSPLFGAELNKLYDLTQQVGERLRSTREGKLYVGIDPSGLQDGTRPGAATLDALLAQLERQRGELAKVEGEVAGKLSEWASDARELAGHADQLAELKNSRSIDLSVQKMSEVRLLTEERTAPVQHAIDQAGLAANQFELEGRIEAARLQLQISRRALENDLAALAAKNEEDLLDRRAESARLDLDVVRNAIDSTLADYNFDMQLASLRQQQAELMLGREQESQNLIAISAQLEQLSADIAVQRAELEVIALEVRALELRKNEVVAAQVAALRRQIEAMTFDIDFFTQRTALIQEICNARRELGQKTLEELAKQAACLSGGSCGPGSLPQLYEQLLANKKQRHQATVDQANKQRTELLARIAEAQATLRDWEAKARSRSGRIDSDRNWAVGLSALPTIEVGFPPSIGGSIDPFKIVAPIFEAATQQFQLAAEGLQFGYQVNDNISQARAQLSEVERQLREANLDDVIAEIEKKQALAELHVRLLDVNEQQVVARGQLTTSAIECRETAGRNVGDLGRARAERAALEAQLDVQAGERSILDVQVQQQSGRTRQAEAAIRKHEAQRAELAVRVTQAQNAIAHFDRMAAAVGAQLDTVNVYQGRVKSLAERRDALQEQIRQHIEQVSLVRLNANETQRKFILEAISDAERVAFQSIATLERQLANNAQLMRLTDELAALEAAARAQLKAYQKEILELMNNRPIPTVERVIWDFEDLSARMTRGAGELLDYKRALLESTNYYYNAYRYRYNLLSEFVGRAPIADDAPYLWTADDATKRIAQCSELGSSPVCSSSSIANEGKGLNLTFSTFVIPATSPMFQELLRSRRTRFEFSEFARDQAGSRMLGHFVLWDSQNMDFRDMRVVGFYLAFPQLEGCVPTLTKIRHTGLGYQRGSMVMRPPLSARPTIVAASNTPEEVNVAVESRIAGWTQNTLSIMQLERRVASDAEGTVPFLGYPLRGAYELTSDDPLECLGKVSELQLTVVFAKPD